MMLSDNIKLSKQCGIAELKANRILGLIRRNIVLKEEEIIIPLYKCKVDTILQCCVQVWQPFHKKDKGILEFTIRELSYEDQLKQFKLTILGMQRIR